MGMGDALGRRVMNRRSNRKIHSSREFRLYLGIVESRDLHFDVVIDGGLVKPQIAMSIS